MLLPAYWSGKEINRCELSGQMGVQKCIWKEEWYLWLKIGKKQREKKKIYYLQKTSVFDN